MVGEGKNCWSPRDAEETDDSVAVHPLSKRSRKIRRRINADYAIKIIYRGLQITIVCRFYTAFPPPRIPFPRIIHAGVEYSQSRQFASLLSATCFITSTFLCSPVCLLPPPSLLSLCILISIISISLSNAPCAFGANHVWLRFQAGFVNRTWFIGLYIRMSTDLPCRQLVSCSEYIKLHLA